MIVCNKCGKRIKSLGEIFQCKRCGKIFCPEHRLPEYHNCIEYKKDLFTKKQEELLKKLKRQAELAKEYEPTHEPTFWDKIRKFFKIKPKKIRKD